MSDDRAGDPMGDPTLHDYFDGRLAPEETARFERALEADPELRERLHGLREMDAALGMLPGLAAPADFTARVARAALRRRGSILRFVLPLAAAAAVVLLALSLRPGRSGPMPPPQEAAPEYVWESDVETYGSLALTDLEDQIVKELEGS